MILTVFLVSILFLISMSNAGDFNNAADPCSQELQVGDCDQKLQRFYFHTGLAVCIPFKYSGCGGNENNFASENECEETCVKKRGARASADLRILNDIEWSAPARLTARRRFPLAFCGLEEDVGVICPGIRRGNYLEQFHYDSRINRCKPFIYNGCAGNANRFGTLWECTQSCVRKAPQRF